MTIEQEIYNLQHACQTATAYEMGQAEVIGTELKRTTPKHLRVGVDSSLVSNGALVKLLIQKGLITHDEYMIALRDMWAEELAMYTAKYPNIKFH